MQFLVIVAELAAKKYVLVDSLEKNNIDVWLIVFLWEVLENIFITENER